MSSKSTLGASSAGIQKSLTSRFNLASALPSKRSKSLVKHEKSQSRVSSRKNQHLGRKCSKFRPNANDFFQNLQLKQEEANEWDVKEATALKRPLSQSCAICYEFYSKKDEQQVILSCCHVFHPHCINAFERFVGFDLRFCPLCRVGGYEKAVTNIGSLSREKNAVVVIQKFVRGYLARQEFCREIRSYYDSPSNATNDETLNRIRQRFYFKEMEKFGEKLMRKIDRNEDSVNKLGSQIDESLDLNRAMVHMVDEIRMTASSSTVTWDVVMKTAFERKSRADQVCPICMSSMDRRRKSVTILSCSHMFCTTCIASFESFNSNITDTNSCPVCRTTSYEKLEVII